jgi:Methylamine utilisation protein MauE
LEVGWLVVRVVLALVLSIAAWAKLADLAGTQQALRDFGVPATLVPALGYILPLTEFGVAAALLPAISAGWGALGALVLMALFSAAIGFHLARGRRFSCRCFGQITAGPTGWSTLGRNGALAALAAAIAWDELGQGRLMGMERGTGLGAIPDLGLLVSVGALSYVIVRGLSRARHLEQFSPAPAVRPARLPIGARAPAVRVQEISGGIRDLAGFVRGRTLLLFWNPGCGSCSAMLEDLKAWEAHPPEDAPSLLVVSLGPAGASQELGLRSPVVIDQSFSVGYAFGATATPTAVLVDAAGSIASDLAVGPDEILSLARWSARGSSHLKEVTP